MITSGSTILGHNLGLGIVVSPLKEVYSHKPTGLNKEAHKTVPNKEKHVLDREFEDCFAHFKSWQESSFLCLISSVHHYMCTFS